MPYIGVSPSNGVRRVHTYTATASQTTFSGAGAEGTSLSYKDSNFVDVYQNGIKLGDADYTSTSGTSIVLAQGASVDDLVVVVVFDVFSVADTVSKADGGTFDGNVTMAGTLGVTGATTLTGGVSGNTTFSGEIITSTSGTSNTRIGENAGDAIASGGNYNVFIGDEAGTAITTGDSNVAVGFEALSTEDAHSRNTAIGHQSLKTQDAGANGQSTAVGYNSGKAVTTGVENVFIGASAGESATTPSSTVAIGKSACGGAVLTGDNNTIVGHSAGDAMTSGTRNVAVGKGALGVLTSGTDNVAIGGVDAAAAEVLGANLTGGGNIAIGGGTLANYTASNSLAVGYRALKASTDGHTNLSVGNYAGDGITTGDNNIMIGYECGSYTTDFVTGGQNVCIGHYITAGGTADSYANALGYNLTAHGGYTTLGKGADDIRASHGSTTWSTVSDERYKKDIEDAKAGLSFINALRPRTFKYKKLNELPETFRAYEDDPTKGEEVFKNTNTNHGFIAQEVKQVIDADSDLKDGFKLWDERTDGSQEIAETALIPMLVKAIQELSAKNTALEARVTALENAE